MTNQESHDASGTSQPALKPRSLAWIRQGIRWRLISLFHKAVWAYRGVRWRLISRLRKSLWFLRRLRRRLLAGLGLAKRGAATIPNRWVYIHARELVFGRRHLRSATATITDLLHNLGITNPGNKRAHRRIRLATRRPLTPSRATTRLTSTVTIPTRRSRSSRRRVGSARTVALRKEGRGQTEVDVGTLTALVPPLLSGRPLVDAHALVRPEASTDDVRVLDEIQRMHLANSQLRSLFVDRGEWEPPTIAVVLSTNRPDFISQAVSQIQNQRFVNVDLAVGLHGCEHPTGLDKLESGAVVAAEIHNYDATRIFGDVLQDLTSKTTAVTIAKWDDDDYYGPHHLIDLWLLHTLSGAAIVGKAAEFVLLEDRDLVVRRRGGPIHHESRFIAGGALLFSRAAFDRAGGWGSVPRGVDQDLLRRLARYGHRSFRGHGLEFVLTRHSAGHTWEADDSYFVDAASETWGRAGLEIAGVIPKKTDPPVAAAAGQRNVSVAMCIPNKDNVDGLARLEASEQYLDGLDRVVVVDDRSDPPLVVERGPGLIEIVRVPEAPGFGAGRSRHHATAATNEDVLFFADADVHVSPTAIAGIKARHGARPTAVHAVIDFCDLDSKSAVGILKSSGIEELEQAATQHWIEGQDWREPHWARSADLAHVRSSTFRSCVGGFVSVDAAVYAMTGGFRDVPVRGVEDVEFGYRLQATGCDQVLYRSPGVLHLGHRTFSSALGGDEQRERERWLARLVPVWSRTLAERADVLSGSEEPRVPLIGLCNAADSVAEANQRYGEGTAVSLGQHWDLLTAPFCITSAEPTADLVDSLPAIMQTFRNHSCGEVVVFKSGATIARVMALWAVNRCLVLGGQQPWVSSANNSPLDGAARIENLVRDRFGSAFVLV